MLIRLFSSETRVSLLTLFFSRLDKRFYVRELARQLGRDVSGVKRELDNLERAGLLTGEKVGNLRYYNVNKASPIYAEIKGMIAKTTGVHEAFGMDSGGSRGSRRPFCMGQTRATQNRVSALYG